MSFRVTNFSLFQRACQKAFSTAFPKGKPMAWQKEIPNQGSASKRSKKLPEGEPKVWLEEVRKLRPEQFLPSSRGGNGERNENLAFDGDSQLGYRIINAIKSIFRKNFERGTAHKIKSLAASNRFLSEHACVLLPGSEDKLKGLSHKQCGTAVEAAFAQVPARAQKDLAKWSVQVALNSLVRKLYKCRS